MVEVEEDKREKYVFMDSRNRAWKCRINGFIMYQFGNKGITLESFNSNKLTIGQLMDLVYISCGQQVISRRHTRETFMNLLEGDVFDDAMEAVGEALQNFFRSPRAEKAAAKEAEEEAKREAARAEEDRLEAEESEENQTPTKESSGTGETTSDSPASPG